MITVTLLPDGRAAAVSPGATILAAARQAGCEIVTTCGGRGRCRSCRVQVVRGMPAPATLADRVQLGDEVREGFRLACQSEAWHDLTALVAPILEETSFQILAETRVPRSAAGFVLDSGVRKVFVTPRPPEDETHPSSDLEELLRTLAGAGAEAVAGVGGRDGAALDVPPDVLRRVPSLLRSQAEGLTLALFDGTLLAAEPGDTRAEAFGVAFDIGTTTVVAYLVDLHSGAVLATVTGINPQVAFGGDLMSRIAFAQEKPANVRALHTKIVRFANGMIEEATARAGVDSARVYKAVVVGNTVMHHLFLGIDPTYVGQAPYAPAVRHGVRTTAADLGLRLNRTTPVLLLPLVAGFVGADAVGMVLSTRIYESPQIRIAVDIGTNGEVVIGSRDLLVACSAPAGPALEGGQLSSGMRGARGAIDSVQIEEDVHYHVIGDSPPMGICGSGVLDAVAGMLDAGLLDDSGRLHPEPPTRVPDNLRRRLIALENGMPSFVLAWGSETAAGRDIALTQADIRQVQLAKGAIRSGIAMLQRLTGTPDDRVAELMLAGGFGNYLNIRSAVRMGLIPPMPLDRVTYVGNAAGLGAQMALISETERRRAEDLATRIQHVSLATHPDFQEVFLEAVQFR
jgi:uncharacterized 2Fe-2S/4Fe-4S cluster protein (DUF4445 family)